MSHIRLTVVVICVFSVLLAPTTSGAQQLDAATQGTSAKRGESVGEGMIAGLSTFMIMACLCNYSSKVAFKGVFLGYMFGLSGAGPKDPPETNNAASARPALRQSAAPSRLLDRMSGVAQVGFVNHGLGNGESFTVSTFMGGVRYWLDRQPSFQPFVQGTAGIEHAFGENAFAVSPSGGVIVPVNNWLVTAEVGIRHAFYEFAGETSVQIMGGVTIPIGR